MSLILFILFILIEKIMTLQERLFSLRDENGELDFEHINALDIKRFNHDLKLLGVRSPQLRALAKELRNNASSFLSILPHQYHE